MLFFWDKDWNEVGFLMKGKKGEGWPSLFVLNRST